MRLDRGLCCPLVSFAAVEVLVQEILIHSCREVTGGQERTGFWPPAGDHERLLRRSKTRKTMR